MNAEGKPVNVGGAPDAGADKAPTDEEKIRRLASEVDQARENLGHLVGNLDRKRHALIRRLPVLWWSLAAAGLVGAGIAIAVAAKRRQQRIPRKLGRLRAALGRVADEPDRLTDKVEMAPSAKVAVGIATAAGSVLAKYLAQRLVQSMKNSSKPPAPNVWA
jgi:hypothetical protein